MAIKATAVLTSGPCHWKYQGSELPEFHKSLQRVHVDFTVYFLIVFTGTWVIMESVGKTKSIGERKYSDSAFILGIALWLKIFAFCPYIELKQQQLLHSFKSSHINRTSLPPVLDSVFLI